MEEVGLKCTIDIRYHFSMCTLNTTKIKSANYASRRSRRRDTVKAKADLASIPGRTEDGPGIDCLRMRHIIPRNWGLRITSYYAQ